MNIEQAHNLSRSFVVAFERCMENRPLPNGQFQWPVAPSVVCAAFSIEIGFKAIILSEGGSAAGHELAKLFGKISASTKSLIINETGLNSQAFKAALELMSNAFTEWRYIYEKDNAHIDLEFLKRLLYATQNAAVQVKK